MEKLQSLSWHKTTGTISELPQWCSRVSDGSMTPWMEYVYMQQPLPNDVTGVPVTVNVVDSNGNYRSIGIATSNIYGTYSLTWTPDIAGDYTVIANFEGSESYYPSSASTAFTASEPAATVTPAAATTTSMADQYFVPAIAGLFVVAIIARLVVLSMLTKRP